MRTKNKETTAQKIYNVMINRPNAILMAREIYDLLGRSIPLKVVRNHIYILSRLGYLYTYKPTNNYHKYQIKNRDKNDWEMIHAKMDKLKGKRQRI